VWLNQVDLPHIWGLMGMRTGWTLGPCLLAPVTPLLSFEWGHILTNKNGPYPSDPTGPSEK